MWKLIKSLNKIRKLIKYDKFICKIKKQHFEIPLWGLIGVGLPGENHHKIGFIASQLKVELRNSNNNTHQLG